MIRVRRLGDDEWRVWRRGRQTGLLQSPEAFAASAHLWLDEFDTEAMWRRQMSTIVSVVALDARDRVVGTAAFDPVSTQIVSMWVDETQRAAGLGRRLLDVALEHTGSHCTGLRVMAANAGAIAFYERCGFVVTSSVVDDEGTLTMSRDV